MPATPRPDPGSVSPRNGLSPDDRPVVGASVDLGSTSVHLLVAGVAGHHLTPLRDESTFLGLGSAVSERGFLGTAARARLTETLTRYEHTARELGAVDVTIIGTEPIRRAADGTGIVHEVRTTTRAPLHVLSHEEEAYLTIIGVTEGLPVTHETLVIDIGGGSSEFCVVDATNPPRAAGLRLGASRLTDKFVIHDPPTPPEIDAMRDSARQAVRGALASSPREIVAVGGTASNLLKVLPEAANGRMLNRDRIREALATLATETAAETSERHVVNPMRAGILPAGATILDAILEHYGVDQVRVSDAGIREGTILAVQHAGPAWRDKLTTLAHGWRV